jgi:hypothetical protein
MRSYNCHSAHRVAKVTLLPVMLATAYVGVSHHGPATLTQELQATPLDAQLQLP